MSFQSADFTDPCPMSCSMNPPDFLTFLFSDCPIATSLTPDLMINDEAHGLRYTKGTIRVVYET